MAAYEQVQKGPLKLKGVAELGVTKRKKKKKDKDKAKLLEAMGTSKKNEEEKRRGLDKRTPAQAAFEKMQEKRLPIGVSFISYHIWESRTLCFSACGSGLSPDFWNESGVNKWIQE